MEKLLSYHRTNRGEEPRIDIDIVPTYRTFDIISGGSNGLVVISLDKYMDIIGHIMNFVTQYKGILYDPNPRFDVPGFKWSVNQYVKGYLNVTPSFVEFHLPQIIKWHKMKNKPKVMWITGLPGAGKTTIVKDIDCAMDLDYVDSHKDIDDFMKGKDRCIFAGATEWQLDGLATEKYGLDPGFRRWYRQEKKREMDNICANKEDILAAKNDEEFDDTLWKHHIIHSLYYGPDISKDELKNWRAYARGNGFEIVNATQLKKTITKFLK